MAQRYCSDRRLEGHPRLRKVLISVRRIAEMHGNLIEYLLRGLHERHSYPSGRWLLHWLPEFFEY